MSVDLNQAAPDFELVSDAKDKVKLSDLQGKKNVLLLFFPAAFTGVCTNELHEISNTLADYEAKNTQVYGISTDTPFTLAEYSKVNAFKFPLLSDHDAIASAAYGTKYNEGEFVFGLSRISRRSAFLIDTEGKIRYAEVLESAGNLPNFEAINAVMNSL